jgi:hypothetical protein
VGATDGSGEHRAILRKNVDGATVDFAETRYHTIGRQFFFRHAEIGALGFGQHEFFDESARIEEFFDSLTRGQFAFRSLLGGGF